MAEAAQNARGDMGRLVTGLAEGLTQVSWIDQAWPAVATEPFEIGVPGRMTTYTAVRVEPAGGGLGMWLLWPVASICSVLIMVGFIFVLLERG